MGVLKHILLWKECYPWGQNYEIHWNSKRRYCK